MKKIPIAFCMAFVAITLTACSTGPKITTSSVPAKAPSVAKTDPVENPEPKPVPDTAPTASIPDPIDSRKPGLPSGGPMSPGIAPIAAPKLVTLQSLSFRPANLMIRKGETVRWMNKESAPHTIISDPFKSETLNMNESFSFTFNEVGTFAYSCGIHPAMKGTIIVKP